MQIQIQQFKLYLYEKASDGNRTHDRQFTRLMLYH